MDINEAAIKLKKIEVIQNQLAHLQHEAKSSSSYDYSDNCNEKAMELIEQLKEI